MQPINTDLPEADKMLAGIRLREAFGGTSASGPEDIRPINA